MSTEFIITLMVLLVGFALLSSGFSQLSSRLDRVLALLRRLEGKDEQVQSERREVVRKRIANASESDVAGYLCHEFGLSQDDPWIASVVKTRNRIGLDATVTMILNREKEPRKTTA